MAAAVALALVMLVFAAYELSQIRPTMHDTERGLFQLRNEYVALEHSIQTNVLEFDRILEEYNSSKTSAARAAAEFAQRRQEWNTWLLSKSGPLHKRALETGSPVGAVDTSNQTNSLIDAELVPLFDNVQVSAFNFMNFEASLLGGDGKRNEVEHEQKRLQARKNLLAQAQKARLRIEDLDKFIMEAKVEFEPLEKRIGKISVLLAISVAVLSLIGALTYYANKSAHERAVFDRLTQFGKMAQELAHEIKQPLTAMNARAFTLQKALPAGADNFQDVLVIRSEIKRLDRIVREFLQLARPTEPNLAPIAAAEAIGEVMKLMEPQLKQQSIECKFDCQKDLLFSGDLQQIKQVLINLITNAAESLRHRGTITLRGRKAVHVLRGSPTDTAIIEVRDTGPGIPAEVRGRIFEPFFSTKGEGSGLGLAIASRIADMHGGKLEFDTDPQTGTVFRLVLPACKNGHRHAQNPPD